MNNYEEINRFEVIDENGRVYVRYNVTVDPHIQDDGQTLKVFILPQELTDDKTTVE
jgi:hypothetical protein